MSTVEDEIWDYLVKNTIAKESEKEARRLAKLALEAEIEFEKIILQVIIDRAALCKFRAKESNVKTETYLKLLKEAEDKAILIKLLQSKL